MRFGAFRPRRPALPRRPGYYNKDRDGFPTNPVMGVPEIPGGQVSYGPHPDAMWPTEVLPPGPGVPCPPGMQWTSADRKCTPMQPQYSGLGAIARTAPHQGMATMPNYWARNAYNRQANVRAFGGYGGYLSPNVGKEWQWDSFAVALAAMAATASVGLAGAAIAHPQKKGGGRGKMSRTIIPFVLPSLGAGVIAYLLRWNMNKGEPCNGDRVDQLPGPSTVGRTRTGTVDTAYEPELI